VAPPAIACRFFAFSRSSGSIARRIASTSDIAAGLGQGRINGFFRNPLISPIGRFVVAATGRFRLPIHHLAKTALGAGPCVFKAL
jgi:hypothetical protein